MHASASNIAPPTICITSQMPTTSNDPTAPSNIRLLQPIHQYCTQSNNLFAILEDYAPDDNNKGITDNITIQASNQRSGTTLSLFLQEVIETPRRIESQPALTNPNASTIHNLWPTVTPTLLPQPRVLRSSHQQPTANPTIIPPQQIL
jgi:hypothetical protein